MPRPKRPVRNGPLYPGEIFALRLAEIRELRGWSQTELAERLEDYGRPVHRTTIAKMETPDHPRARNVPLEDVLAIAAVLGVAPIHLFVPLDDDARVRLFVREVRESGKVVRDAGVFTARNFREWVRGRGMITNSSIRLFLSQQPDHEKRELTDQWRRAAAESGVGDPPDDGFLNPGLEDLRDPERTETDT